jgi:VWFA-related protein
MRYGFIFGCLCWLLLLAHAPAQSNKASAPYKIEFDPKADVSTENLDKASPSGLYVKVKFAITMDGAKVDSVAGDTKLVIEENGIRVKEMDVPRPSASEDLSVILAIDTSGSMKEHGRMEQARVAAAVFLDKLPRKADCGLILFDHEIRQSLPRTYDRGPLSAQINAIQPRGGTAYLDAGFAGVQMLKDTSPARERALVLMTDGIDLNSSKTLQQVIAEAKQNRVRIYTIGIGEPGKLEQVSTALVLDHSGSMKPPADDRDTTSKIQALHLAGSRFVSSMSSAGRCSLIPFSSQVSTPQPFTNDKFSLAASIGKLVPKGETALYDATYTAIGVLEADGSRGKRAVVAMTDGIDNTSRRRVDEVIERAKEAKVPLYMLGFGRENEIDRVKMERMANETGGRYYHAKNKDSLLEIFENLSIQLHDDGIDEFALGQLAQQTGGQYYPAKNVSELKLVLEQAAKNIQKQGYEVSFLSLNQRADGTERNVGLKLVRRGVGGGSDEVIEEQKGRYLTRGLVVAEMNHLVFLGMLGLLGVFIALPALLRRRAA